MLKAIVFDFDGVIVDSEPLHFAAFVEVGGPLGVTMDYPTYLRDYIGFDDRDAFRYMLASVGREPEPGQIESLGHEKAEAFERLIADKVITIPGVLELIDDATATGLPIAISSGATKFDIDLMLGALDKADRFPVIITADDVARSKPDPTSYMLAVERLAAAFPEAGITPVNCLAIEDTTAGLTSATAAGLMTLGLTTTGSADALAQADRVIPDLRGVSVKTLRGWYED